MNDLVYEIISADRGDHILVYKFDGYEYVFERKIFIYASEFRK